MKTCDCGREAVYFVMYDGVVDKEHTKDTGYTYYGAAGEVCRICLDEILLLKNDHPHFAIRYIPVNLVVFNKKGAWINNFPDWRKGVSLGDWNYLSRVQKSDQRRVFGGVFADPRSVRVNTHNNTMIKLRREDQLVVSLVLRVGDYLSIGAKLHSGHIYDAIYKILPADFDELVLRYIEMRGDLFPAKVIEHEAS